MTSIKISEFSTIDRPVLITIMVAALGYFVDIYDLLLFSIVRVQSLKDIGVAEEDLLSIGIRLINMQMAGLLIGGFIWGIMADRVGRVSTLFGSIALYSFATIANGFVSNVNEYAILRMIAGIGLAGELGVGVSLASELLPRKLRGLGTAFIVSIGLLGAALAAVLAELFDWRVAYIIGGTMGLVLMALRIDVQESGMYETLAYDRRNVSRGNFFILLTRPHLRRKYLAVLLVGAPIWGITGVLITFSPEFAKDFGMTYIPEAGMAVLIYSVGFTIGGVCIGIMSQIMSSRRKAIALFLDFLVVIIGMYLGLRHNSLPIFYLLCGLLGIGVGYWSMFIQVVAEQFGTNIRATAATTIPNLVRGLTIPMTAGFHLMIPYLGMTGSGLALMGITMGLAFMALMSLRETFETDLDYTEG
ncbi:MAG: MFS transporter [Micavibrio aeruginosavorus]|nr:MFS transporter [Micavibrio aeruginosavorus]